MKYLLFLFLKQCSPGSEEHQAEATLAIDKMYKSKQGSRSHQGLIHWSCRNEADFSDNLPLWPSCMQVPKRNKMSSGQ